MIGRQATVFLPSTCQESDLDRDAHGVRSTPYRMHRVECLLRMLHTACISRICLYGGFYRIGRYKTGWECSADILGQGLFNLTPGNSQSQARWERDRMWRILVRLTYGITTRSQPWTDVTVWMDTCGQSIYRVDKESTFLTSSLLSLIGYAIYNPLQSSPKYSVQQLAIQDGNKMAKLCSFEFLISVG